jgi:hypothetical protein
MRWLDVPPGFTQHDTLIINWFFTCCTAIRKLIGKTGYPSHEICRCFFLLRRPECLNICQVIEEVIQAFGTLLLPLQLQSALKPDADEKLKVVGKTSD